MKKKWQLKSKASLKNTNMTLVVYCRNNGLLNCIIYAWLTHYNDFIMSRMGLKSSASSVFIQAFIQAQIIENIKASRHWPLCGESLVTIEFPAQMASNVENVSIWWRHHERFNNIVVILLRHVLQTKNILSWYNIHKKHDFKLNLCDTITKMQISNQHCVSFICP